MFSNVGVEVFVCVSEEDASFTEMTYIRMCRPVANGKIKEVSFTEATTLRGDVTYSNTRARSYSWHRRRELGEEAHVGND